MKIQGLSLTTVTRVGCLVVCACGKTPATNTATTVPAANKISGSVQMAAFADGGYELSGGEYWPNIGDKETAYPEEVLWGFYPKKGVTPPDETDPNVDDATPAAIACAERAFAELRAFIKSDPPELKKIVADGGPAGYSNKFYLWTNDYTRATDPFTPGARPAKLWYWKRKTPKEGRPPGFWKWESSVSQKGQCTTPDLVEAKAYMTKALAELPEANAAAAAAAVPSPTPAASK
jgi:hypothetical protein